MIAQTDTDTLTSMKSATKSILVVDDEFDVRAIVELILGMQNYDVVTTPSALLALEKLQGEQPPALILTDRMMPVMDGVEFCERVRANPQWRDVPIIMMSAADEPKERNQGLWNAYLHKPLDMDDLLHAVERIIGR
ncbi:MAG TPA: response regulator [Burkholderiales bacterium]|nr:response regulator [Burkholderiales bacterium]